MLAIQCFILAILLALLIGATELRYWYRYSVLLPPNDAKKNTITWGHTVIKNKDGFRERDFEPYYYQNRDREHFVIAILGDSLTWGVGLSEKQRYSNLLEEKLRNKFPNKKITVLNLGKKGLSTVAEKTMFFKHYPSLRPDLVIVGFCRNDPKQISSNWSSERERFFSGIRPFLIFLNEQGFQGTARLISDSYDRFLEKTGKIPTADLLYAQSYQKDSPSWRQFTAALAEIYQLSRESSTSRPIFISLNSGYHNNTRHNNFPADYRHPSPKLQEQILRYAQAEDAARHIGYITVNCMNEFKELGPYVMAVIPGEDSHPDAKMNEIYADKLFLTIMENNLIH